MPVLLADRSYQLVKSLRILEAIEAFELSFAVSGVQGCAHFPAAHASHSDNRK
jgi:hypothetical protein